MELWIRKFARRDFREMKYAQIRDDSRLNLFHRLFLFTVNKLTLIVGNYYENQETMRIMYDSCVTIYKPRN